MTRRIGHVHRSGPTLRPVSSAIASPVTSARVAPSISAKVGGYIALTKPRIIELLLISTVPTMVVAERGLPSVWLMVATVIGGTLSAGGANAINMYVDRDIDALMDRTKGRPLVTGVMTPRAALTFAIAIEALSFGFLWVFVNLISAVLAVSACLFYVFVYTLWLKRTSERNIVIGGAAGAAPVLIGWTAVTGRLDWAPVVLFAVMFYWTPPHFWALAIKYKDDYSRADVPMLPSVAAYATVARKIVAYTVVVVALTVVFGVVAELGAVYHVSAGVLGAAFLWLAVKVQRTESPAMAMRLFTYSITYITLLFGAMAADVLVRFGA
ncbi:MAG: heme o synthase [Microthrixaceae bacterium]|nr:heme o synthase [Microthrixaceae bacterium]